MKLVNLDNNKLFMLTTNDPSFTNIFIHVKRLESNYNKKLSLIRDIEGFAQTCSNDFSVKNILL